MKRFLLTLILLLAFVTPSFQADASGSNTVFLPVRLKDYKFTTAVTDTFFNNSKLYNYLENSQTRNVVVARVNSYIYRTTYYYTYWGYDMNLDFQSFETVTFRYYPRFGAVIGVTSNEDLVVLLPQVPSAPTFGTGILHDID